MTMGAFPRTSPFMMGPNGYRMRQTTGAPLPGPMEPVPQEPKFVAPYGSDIATAKWLAELIANAGTFRGAYLGDLFARGQGGQPPFGSILPNGINLPSLFITPPREPEKPDWQRERERYGPGAQRPSWPFGPNAARGTGESTPWWMSKNTYHAGLERRENGY